MTTNHTELCECDCLNYCGDDPDLSKRKARPCRNAIDWAHEQALAIEAERELQRKVGLFESQAARIQQQALSYESLLAQHTASLERIDELELQVKRFISLQAQCDDHLARIAGLEREKDEAEKHAAVVSSENFDLEARIAELDRKHKEAWDDCGELNATNHELLAACGEKDRRIAELEKERDALIHDNAQLVKAASAEATLASEALAERDALKEDAERWRIIESTLPTDELQDIAIIVAAEHSVNVANGFSKAPADLLDAAVAALQAEKEARS